MFLHSFLTLCMQTNKCHEGAEKHVNQEVKRDHWTRRRHFNDGRSFGIKVMCDVSEIFTSICISYSTWQQRRANKPLKL